MDAAQNREAALQLLSDLKSKDILVQQNSTEVIPLDTKIIFRKSSSKPSNNNLENSNSSIPTEEIFGGSKKVKMAEYVVGTKKSKKKGMNDVSDAKSEKKDVVKLSYLQFQDDDEEEEMEE